MAYHDGQPFNDNMLRPCPMLENPGKLQEMVEKSGARSTDMQSPEPVENLTKKCQPYAENWIPTAGRLWSCSPQAQRVRAARKVTFPLLEVPQAWKNPRERKAGKKEKGEDSG